MINTIHIGPLAIHMYGLMMALGFLSALWLCLLRSGKKGLDKELIWNLFFCAIVGGIVGSRILFLIVEIPNILKDPSILWNFSNGFVVYGGVLGGIFCCWAYCKYKKTSFLPYFDLIMPAVSLAQGIGRIGCFFAGCCYGRETDSFIGFTYKVSEIAPVGVKLIPTQLISSVGDVLICLLLLLYDKKRSGKPGSVAAMWMILYGIGRFVIEFFRNDFRGSIGPFSTSQMISFVIVAAGAAFFFFANRKSASASGANE